MMSSKPPSLEPPFIIDVMLRTWCLGDEACRVSTAVALTVELTDTARSLVSDVHHVIHLQHHTAQCCLATT